MTRKSNLFGKRRDLDNPYAVYRDSRTGWEYKVLKTYQRSDKESDNEWARWFCFVKSPACLGGEYGDVYVSVVRLLPRVYCTVAWQREYGDR